MARRDPGCDAETPTTRPFTVTVAEDMCRFELLCSSGRSLALFFSLEEFGAEEEEEEEEDAA